MRRRSLCSSLAASLALAALPAAATVFTGSFHANEAQATNCSVGSTTEGPGTVTYDDQTGVFGWSFTFGDNAPDFDDGDLFGGGIQNAAHFHENVSPFPLEVSVGVGTPNVGSAVITPAQADALLAESGTSTSIHRCARAARSPGSSRWTPSCPSPASSHRYWRCRSPPVPWACAASASAALQSSPLQASRASA